jgi:hypothetical protein
MTTKEFGFEAATDGDAATMAAQQAVAVAERSGIDPKLVRVLSTKKIHGSNHYVSMLSFPDARVEEPGATHRPIMGPTPIRMPVPTVPTDPVNPKTKRK